MYVHLLVLQGPQELKKILQARAILADISVQFTISFTFQIASTSLINDTVCEQRAWNMVPSITILSCQRIESRHPAFLNSSGSWSTDNWMLLTMLFRDSFSITHATSKRRVSWRCWFGIEYRYNEAEIIDELSTQDCTHAGRDVEE